MPKPPTRQPGRVDIDTAKGRAKCVRCGAVAESRSLARLLAFAREHHLCPGESAPVLLGTAKEDGR